MQQNTNPQLPKAQAVLDPGAAVAAKYNLKRSWQWGEVEQAFLDQHNHKCAMCAITGRKLVQVHHIAPFHYISSPHIQRGDLEFDPHNLIPLCQGPGTNDHHELIGHMGDFQYFNKDVNTDMTGPWKDMIASLIKQQTDWLARHQNHYPLVNVMSPQNITDFIALLVTWYGPKPQASANVLIEQWYGFKPRWNSSAGASNASTSAPASNTSGT